MLKCRVDLGLKHMEKMGENTQIWAFRVFSTGRIGSPTGRTCSGFPVSTSFRIVAITSSFLIRFE